MLFRVPCHLCMYMGTHTHSVPSLPLQHPVGDMELPAATLSFPLAFQGIC